MGLLMVAGWALLVVLTVGPIFSAEKREGEGELVLERRGVAAGSPLAGLGYYMSRHAMRKVNAAQYEPKHAEG